MKNTLLVTLLMFIFLGLCSSILPAQTIHVIPNPDVPDIFGYTNGSPLSGYAGDPIEYNNKLYLQYQPASSIFSGDALQLAVYNGGDLLSKINNPGAGHGYAFQSESIVFNNKLYINYIAASGTNQLAQYDGTSLTLIPNPDASLYGYQGDPVIYNNKLYIRYANTTGVQQVAQFDGTTVTLIPNPDASQYGYQGDPIIFNNKLYLRYSNNVNGAWELAQFDGTTVTLIPNPDASQNGYQGDPIIFNNKLYMRYYSTANVNQMMVYDGSANPSLINNPYTQTNNGGYIGFPIIYNDSLFIRYQDASGVNLLGKLNGTSLVTIPNPDGSSYGYYNTPIIYNNRLCIFYRNVSGVHQLAYYNGGGSLQTVPNPDASSNGYWDKPILYGNNLCFQYYDASGNFDLGYYDGTSLKLIPNSAGSYSGYPIVSNDTLFIQLRGVTYQNTGNLAYITQEALPVTLLNFDGLLKDNGALLSWKTVNEFHNKGFYVQRSIDGQTFTAIGFVAGAGNSSSLNKYNYTDDKMLSGANYYRLKQIDLDGKFIYSSVIKLDYARFAWSILGNPISGNEGWVQLQLDKKAIVSLQVISVDGTIINTINKGSVSAGTYSIPLNLLNTVHGMYVVRLLVDNQVYAKKIIR